MRSLTGVAALSAAALLLAGCAGGGAAPTPTATADGELTGEPVNVGIFYGLTGATASFSKAYLAGVDAAVDYVNTHGGVDGRPIVTSVTDTGTDPTRLVSLLTGVLNSATPPDAVVPGATSAEVLAALPLLTSSNVLSVNPATSQLTNDPAKYPYNFSTSPMQIEAIGILADAFEADGIETLAVLSSADASGDDRIAGITQVAEKAGVEIVDVERPAGNALDYTIEMQRMIDAEPDAIFYDLINTASSALVLTARDTLGATDIPIYTGSAVSATVVSSLVSESATELCFLPVFSFSVKNEGAEYLEPLYVKFLGATSSAYSGGLGWDAIMTIATAFRATGGDSDGAALADALEADGIPADTSALYPNGTPYSAKSHFPTVTEGSTTIIPCSSTITNGLWNTN